MASEVGRYTFIGAESLCKRIVSRGQQIATSRRASELFRSKATFFNVLRDALGGHTCWRGCRVCLRLQPERWDLFSL